VLAEYGTVGVRVMEACGRARIPLIVHFHGFDASVHEVLHEHEQTYPRLFDIAAAIIAVSPVMRARLIELGAPAHKVHYNPCGVDCSEFAMTDAASAPPTIVAAGRLVDKKAPHLTLLAFAEVVRARPDARLRVIGDGPLMSVCRDLTAALNLGSAVTLLGRQPHQIIRDEMQNARVFVQHSVTAFNGDAEGTPVAVMEAGASGLPAVSTHHAGIDDVVVHGETGFLVDEYDVTAMGRYLRQLIEDPDLAGRMGRAARARVESRFSMDARIATLWSIIEQAVGERPAAVANDGRVRQLPAGV
jgi:glycosyltransferase involved in cell wall biosynthesis